MVRLMLVLAPVMCILAGIGVSATLTTYMKNLDPIFGGKKSEQTAKKSTKKISSDYNYPMKNEVGFLVEKLISTKLVCFYSCRRFVL